MPGVFDLSGRRALITGSGQGIGLALASALAEAGAAIVLNGRAAAKLDRAAATLRARGFAVETAPFDVTDPAAVREGIARVVAAGPIDILVNNAGIQRRAPLHDFPEETWDELMRTNLDAVFFVAKAVARHMIPRGSGKIINICSVQSELGRPGIAPWLIGRLDDDGNILDRHKQIVGHFAGCEHLDAELRTYLVGAGAARFLLFKFDFDKWLKAYRSCPAGLCTW